MSDGKFSCPDCGSENAVSKATAWDARAEIPPQVKDNLERLVHIEVVARILIDDSPKTPDEETVTVTVRKDLLEKLAAAMGMTL